MVRPCEENESGAHIEKNARCGHTGEKKKSKRRRGRPKLRWKDACKRDMTQAGLKEGNATSRAEWRKKLISYTGDPKLRDKPGMKENKMSAKTLCDKGFLVSLTHQISPLALCPISYSFQNLQFYLDLPIFTNI